MAKRFHALHAQASASQRSGKVAISSGQALGLLQTSMRRAGLRYYAEAEFNMFYKKQRQMQHEHGVRAGAASSCPSSPCKFADVFTPCLRQT